MDLDRRVCDRARRSRDPRFDGRFFIAVTTTGIYCRPICPARSQKDENVVYFPTAASAEAAGFRPCLRCRPEASPGTPAWAGTSGIVSRALRLIADGALRGTGGGVLDDKVDGERGVERLADRLGVTARHLRRLFVKHLGATPLEVALTRRVHFAKRLIDDTSLPIQQIAHASGFGSVRRFNGQIRRTFSRTPTELRRLRRGWPGAAGTSPDCYRFQLAYRPPYDWDGMLSFLAARATAGVESVDGSRYRRTVAVDGRAGTIDVFPVASKPALGLEVRFPDPRALLLIVERVRCMFDLAADPQVIDLQLGGDRLLRRALDACPGVRMPGAWDGFELAVRAILGQQVSVRGATTIAGRVATLFGTDVETDIGVARLFPDAGRLVNAPLENAGVMPSRAATIRRLAQAVCDGALTLAPAGDSGAAMSALTDVPGIGPWTASYVAMRALGEPDAFPAGDLVLRRMAGNLTARELERRSQAWRPWRAYAVMLLWRVASLQSTKHSGGRNAASKPDMGGRRAGRAARADRALIAPGLHGAG
jgi:AraC family transcriptional regulator of adaptative response / DNA-3-methyladenine glycosylase II